MTVAGLWPATCGETLPSPVHDPIEKVLETLVCKVLIVAGIEIVKTLPHEHTDSLQLSLAPLKQFHRLAQRFARRRETTGLHASGDEFLMVGAELHFPRPSVTRLRGVGIHSYLTTSFLCYTGADGRTH